VTLKTINVEKVEEFPVSGEMTVSKTKKKRVTSLKIINTENKMKVQKPLSVENDA
jgi:hypothetical protein